MSLENDTVYSTTCLKCPDECQCSRLALALEVVHREVAEKNALLVERNAKLERLCQLLLAKNDEIKAENKELRVKVFTRDATIREMNHNIARAADVISINQGLYNYISILENFIHKKHGPQEIVCQTEMEGIQIIKRI